MTNAGRRSAGPALAGAIALVATILPASPAHALTLDEKGAMRIGLRTYTAVRFGTEEIGSDDNPLAFPHSSAGHVRQHRSFISLDFSHDIRGYTQSGYGLTRMFHFLDPDVLQYSLQYRGEFEGIYDYGPDEYRNYSDQLRAFRRDVPDIPPVLNPKLPAGFIREKADRLNRIARQRHRLFLAYLDVEKGPVFVRAGRQILAWGETDIFRLLDNINPLDDSFGGFFISLDERRLPIEMVRTSYAFGSIGPLADAFVEGFAATGNRVSQWPGIPEGSPWNPGGLAYPNPQLSRQINLPAREDVRGGARFVFTAQDITFTLAHYYTYLDVPGIRFKLPGCQPRPPGGAPCLTGVNGTLSTNAPSYRHAIKANVEFPRVPITGAAMTFALPSLYTIVRSEVAYFQDQPFNRQGQGPAAASSSPAGSARARKLRRENNTEGGLDPFVYPTFLDLTRRNPVQGRLLQRDTFNMAIGADVNRYIRWLNSHQTFFFSTQFLYRHVYDSPGDLVLPVPYRNIGVPSNAPLVGKISGGCGANGNRNCRLRPRFYRLADDQFLQTLLITTTYAGGRIIPALGMFYDWQGAGVVQPGVTFVWDPFRFVFDYTAVLGAPTGQFGAVRDRDNVRFQAEFVF
jgi:hypothetical protein